jgi:hypothetical protein
MPPPKEIIETTAGKVGGWNVVIGLPYILAVI